MNTGISSLSKLPETTAIYPFHGAEVGFTIFIALFFVVFIVRQLVMESRHHKDIIGSFTASPAE
jgi:hypothetical protein